MKNNLPQSAEAEQSVLGGLMLAPESLGRIAWLAEDDFHRRDHQLIYRAIKDLEAKSVSPDAVTLGDFMESSGLSDQIGGIGYLVQLASTTPSAANIVAYAEIVKEKSLLRKLIGQGNALVNAAFSTDGKSARDIAALFCQSLTELSASKSDAVNRSLRQIGKLWYEQLIERMNGTKTGLSTPWGKLNALTSGLQPGDLFVLAGRPGMGKSAAAIALALCAALRGIRVMMFSLEMTDLALFNRAVAALGNVPLEFLKSPDDREEYWSSVTHAVSKLRDAPLVIDETPGLTIEQIAIRAKREHLRQPLGLVIIDHLHIVQLPGKANANEASERGEVSSGAKRLAKALGSPVVALAQLNRGVESRTNKRPAMSDLRASGSIEQDADLIAFLYRDDYYAEQEGRQSDYPGMIELILSKNREGRTGKIWLRDALAFGRIDDHDGDDPVSAAPKIEKRGFGRPWAGRERAIGD